MEEPTSSWGLRNRITLLTLQERDDDDGLHIIFRLNTDFFPKQSLPFGLCHGQATCFLCEKASNLKHYSGFDRLLKVPARARTVSRQPPGSIPSQSMWYFWWKTWKWDTFFFLTICVLWGFPSSIILMLDTNLYVKTILIRPISGRGLGAFVQSNALYDTVEDWARSTFFSVFVFKRLVSISQAVRNFDARNWCNTQRARHVFLIFLPCKQLTRY